jgi:hypothetical protein
MFFLPSITHANGFVDFVSGLFGNVASGPLNAVLGFFKSALSTILSDTVTPLLNAVMSYQNFFTNGVNAGWTATRDFANLFFALILLFIAIATVLNTGGLDNFTAKRMLPKFIFAALLINFSKAIVGFLIDISQIIMISLYNTFGPTLTDSIGSASKISQAATESPLSDAVINLFTIILIVILIFVFLWTAMILVVRIITLWFVIMTSPLAFVSSMIPGLSSFYNDWKTKLQEALVTGPVLMFLLYLAVTVMNAGVNPNEASGGNLLDNGNILNYVLVIGLVISANIQAQKAGQQGPPIISKAVGVAGTIATLGIGGYIGAGGYKTSQALKTTGDLAKGGVKNTDKLAGGATSIVGRNTAYESAKKDLKNKQIQGGFGQVVQGFSPEGKKKQLESFEKQKAIQLENTGEIYKSENARYLKMISSIEAEAAKDAKEKSSIPELGQELKKALDKGDKITARALASRVSEIKGGWAELFGGKDGKEGVFAEYAKDNPGNQAAQLDSFITKNFETRKDGSKIYMLDKSGNPIPDQYSPIANNFRSRQAQLLKDKGSANFAVGLVERDTKRTPYSKTVEKGIIGAGAEFAKNDQMFSGAGSFDFNAFYTIIQKETSVDLLADPKSWTPFNNERTGIIDELTKKLNADPDNPDNPKIRAALKGLGSSASSRVTSS